MVNFISSTGETVTIGDSSLPGVNTKTTWGLPVKDPGTPLMSYSNSGFINAQRIWKTQPAVRTVVSFAAKHVAALPWKIYERVDDDNRVRAHDSLAEQLLRYPHREARVTSFNLLNRITTDLMLYDIFCVALLVNEDNEYYLQRIPPRLLTIKSDALGNITRVLVNLAQGPVDLSAEKLAISTGWSANTGNGVSPLTTLRQILEEQAHAVQWRNAQWDRSPKFNGYIKRPPEATSGRWEPVKREQFVQSWRDFRMSAAGGTPILEDGMEYVSLNDTIKPADAQDIEGRRLSTVEVCGAFHIPPELVGARQGTFSNIAAFRQMLYGPTLGPVIDEIRQAFNAEIIPALADEGHQIYGELDRNSAMNGSFLEQASYLQTAVGGPYLTRAEARAALDYPKLKGTDQLITPLNVTEGGLASPTDTGKQNIQHQQAKALPPGQHLVRQQALSELNTVKKKQEKTLVEALRSIYVKMMQSHDDIEDPEDFHDQWDTILMEAINPSTWASALAGARSVLAEYNPEQSGWAASVMKPYVTKIGQNAASKIADGMLTSFANLDEMETNPDDDEDSDDDPRTSLLDRLKDSTAVAWAASLIANAAGFGRQDAAKASGLATKRWQVTSAHPRPSHAQMDGEATGIDDEFSNGARWPGDGGLDVDEVAGCTCVLEYEW